MLTNVQICAIHGTDLLTFGLIRTTEVSDVENPGPTEALEMTISAIALIYFQWRRKVSGHSVKGHAFRAISGLPVRE